MRFAPSSTARFRTRFASSRSFGQPQMPSPVIRIAPNPSRFTVRSPPILNVLLMFVSAPSKSPTPITDNPTPLARLNLTNSRRSILLLITPPLFQNDGDGAVVFTASTFSILIRPGVVTTVLVCGDTWDDGVRR